MIDPHVHCRDWNESHKETVAHALSVAERAGISGIFDMPNTSPPLITREAVAKRIEDAKRCNSKVFYGLYVGVTSDPLQIKEAVQLYSEYFPSVVGFKMYAGHSVGNLAVKETESQRVVYELLSDLNYAGVLAVHCEKESSMKPELWDPLNPITHSSARPSEAEIESVRDQLKFASSANFSGTLHIAHISHPDTVALIQNEKKKHTFNITCGVTPHHCLLSNDMMNSQNGLFYKVNPPLRTEKDAQAMLEYLLSGAIDVIETDHAPHTKIEKLNSPYMSGFPGLPVVPHFLKYLRKNGFSEKQLTACTHDRVCEIFQFHIPNSNIESEYNLHLEYEVDVYEHVRAQLYS